MLNAMKLLFLGAIGLGATACTASPDSDARYVEKRIPGGPRPDQYVLVRADQHERVDRPYALTGETRKTSADRMAERPAPSHPKGTHDAY